MSIHALAIVFAPGCAFVLAWALTGIGSHRNHLHHSLRNHGEGDGVGELGVHGQSNYNNLGAE